MKPIWNRTASLLAAVTAASLLHLSPAEGASPPYVAIGLTNFNELATSNSGNPPKIQKISGLGLGQKAVALDFDSDGTLWAVVVRPPLPNELYSDLFLVRIDPRTSTASAPVRSVGIVTERNKVTLSIEGGCADVTTSERTFDGPYTTSELFNLVDGACAKLLDGDGFGPNLFNFWAVGSAFTNRDGKTALVAIEPLDDSFVLASIDLLDSIEIGRLGININQDSGLDVVRVNSQRSIGVIMYADNSGESRLAEIDLGTGKVGRSAPTGLRLIDFAAIRAT